MQDGRGAALLPLADAVVKAEQVGKTFRVLKCREGGGLLGVLLEKTSRKSSDKATKSFGHDEKSSACTHVCCSLHLTEQQLHRLCAVTLKHSQPLLAPVEVKLTVFCFVFFNKYSKFQ